MRTLEELCAALSAGTVPWCMDGWDRDAPPPLPYAVVREAGVNWIYGDNANSTRRRSWRIEVYAHKSAAWEAREAVTAALAAAGISWGEEPGGEIDETGVMVAYVTVATLG